MPRLAILCVPLLALFVATTANAQLIHEWTFNGNLTDLVGTAHGTLYNGAQVVGGKLTLDGANDFFRTVPINNTVTDKTLVAWVSLNTLAQAGGSALSLETVGGGVFDGIVYGERTAGQWMAGSDFHNRSNGVSNGGALETVTSPGQVMMAITYQGNNISIYRNGALYAAYNDPSQATFNSGAADAIVGWRHTGGTGTPYLNGSVDQAQIYSGVLSAGQISALYTAGPTAAQAELPDPVHRWSFNDGTANDSIGSANGTLMNGATISGGQLQLDGVNDFVRTTGIGSAITNKTLVAWTTLSNLSQQGGSALSIENAAGGDVFDGIVFGERTSGQWMAGSEGFNRSNGVNNGGPIETSTGEMMMAIAYRSSGQIDIYRDGQLYASYMEETPILYGAGADVLLGLRHEDAGAVAGTALGADAFLAGLINEARIYDLDLTQEQIQLLYQLGPNALQTPEPSAIIVWGVLAMTVGALVWYRRQPSK